MIDLLRSTKVMTLTRKERIEDQLKDKDEDKVVNT